MVSNGKNKIHHTWGALFSHPVHNTAIGTELEHFHSSSKQRKSSGSENYHHGEGRGSSVTIRTGIKLSVKERREGVVSSMENPSR